jgi:hypothetical protein
MTDYPGGTTSVGRYATPETVQRAYDDADLVQAVRPDEPAFDGSWQLPDVTTA